METKPDFAFVVKNGHLYKVFIKKITRLQSDNGYTYIFQNDGKRFTSCNSLADCQRKLQKYSFCRVHQSHLVSLTGIDKIKCGKNWVAILSDKSEVPVSRRKKEELLSHFIIL